MKRLSEFTELDYALASSAAAFLLAVAASGDPNAAQAQPVALDSRIPVMRAVPEPAETLNLDLSTLAVLEFVRR